MTMDIKKTTPGPWRWGDWSVRFGAIERKYHRYVLEANNGDSEAPIIRDADDGAEQVMRIEEAIENEHDMELIRRAPELAAALAEMLEMFGGNMDRADHERFRALAGVV